MSIKVDIFQRNSGIMNSLCAGLICWKYFLFLVLFNETGIFSRLFRFRQNILASRNPHFQFTTEAFTSHVQNGAGKHQKPLQKKFILNGQFGRWNVYRTPLPIGQKRRARNVGNEGVLILELLRK
jgi:hypothetical protein